MHVHQAIVRTPSKSLVNGLTSSSHLGEVDYRKALIQHQAYIDTLCELGVEVTVLPALDEFADACFVEDVAIVTESLAVRTRPGAPSRLGEVDKIHPILKTFYRNHIRKIDPPATLEGGDVLMIENKVFVGLSDRTNQAGAKLLAEHLSICGREVITVGLRDLLHLKTGISYLGENTILVCHSLKSHAAFDHYNKIIVDDDELYCANSLNINGMVLMPQGFSKTQEKVLHQGFLVRTLDMSEFRKVDGGLSCLSLRL